MTPDSEGFNYPRVDTDLCVDCHACERVCPELNPITKPKETIAYMASANDIELKRRSSSGGVFSLIADDVLRKGGVVCGAAFTDDFTGVKHICIEHADKLDSLRRSKYVQSEIGNCFSQIKEFLALGRLVLFAGTPCQVAGLTRFLGRDYDNLLKVEVICHGVPSPEVWREYLRLRAKGAKVIDVNFRDKSRGWDNYALTITTARATRRRQRYNDPFMMLFVNDVINRPSCSECSFKSGCSGADITIGDFWGLDKSYVESDFDYKSGLTLLLILSPRGSEIIGRLKDLKVKKVQKFHNSAYLGSAPVHVDRELFYTSFFNSPAKAISAFSRQFKLSPILRAKMWAYRLIHR